MISLKSFSHELQSKLKESPAWLTRHYNNLNVAVGSAMSQPPSLNPITGQAAPPVLGAVKNLVSGKPSPTRTVTYPRLTRILNSAPVKTVVPILDQGAEFLKLAQVAPYQQKTQYSCSAACLKSVLEHWGADRFAEHEIMHEIGVDQKAGAEVDQITAAAQQLGFEAYDKEFPSLDAAKEVTDQGTPIIADIQSFNKPGSGHYVVITDITDNIVHLMDPNAEGNHRTITRAEMERRWWDRRMTPPHDLMMKWGVVVTPRESMEKTAKPVREGVLYNIVKKYPKASIVSVMGASGAAKGAIRGFDTKDKVEHPKHHVLKSTLAGGAIGTGSGFLLHHQIGKIHKAYAKPPKTPTVKGALKPMEKVAFSSGRGALVGGAIGTAAGAALGGLPKTYYDVEKRKRVTRTTGQRILGGVLGGGLLGVQSAALGHEMGRSFTGHHYDPFHGHYGQSAGGGYRQRYSPPPRSGGAVPSEFKGKNRAELKNLKRQFSRDNHPDLAKDTRERMVKQKNMQEFMEKYQRFEKHPDFPKTAYMRGFLDEITQIFGP